MAHPTKPDRLGSRNMAVAVDHLRVLDNSENPPPHGIPRGEADRAGGKTSKQWVH